MERPGISAGNPGLFGHIGENPISVVVIENVAAVLGDKEVGKSVVVIVAPGAPQTVTRAGNASLFGDIRKSAIAVVAIKRVADGDAAVVHVSAVHQVNVLPAVPFKLRPANPTAKSPPLVSHASF